jgi:hypothetical protein
LAKLLDLGWIRRLDRAGYSWFPLAPDPKRREAVRRLLVWQDQWLVQLEVAKLIVNGQAVPA